MSHSSFCSTRRLAARRSDLGRWRLELVDDGGECLAGGGAIRRGEDLLERASDHRLGLLGVAEHVADEVHRAALPLRAEHLTDRVSKSLVGIADRQTHCG
jgi:hypothetical protein